MREVEGKVAVVTGAASGIGFGMSKVFADAGMKIVMADVEEEALANAAGALRNAGADVLDVITDVSSADNLEELRDKAFGKYQRVNVLCNNAGVAGGGGPLWQTTANDWEWVIGVNLMGVVHGVQAFTQAMIDSAEEGHIVNTSSVLGLSTGPGSIYNVTKHAVTRLSEGLYYELKAADTKIGVSVLCPGMIATNIISSDRNRPAALTTDIETERTSAGAEMRSVMQDRFLTDGMPPEEVGRIVLDGIQSDRFYLLTHEDVKERLKRRIDSILNDENPAEIIGPAFT